MCLCRDKGLKKLRRDLLGNPASSVGNADLGHLLISLRGGYRQFPLRRLLHRFDGVADQVQDNLLDLDLVYQDQGCSGYPPLPEMAGYMSARLDSTAASPER